MGFRYSTPYSRYVEEPVVESPSRPNNLERDFRQATVPLQAETETVNVHAHTRKVETNKDNNMGYYDDDGHYHSFRRGVQRAADRIIHPIHGSGHHHHQHHHNRSGNVIIEERDVNITATPASRGSSPTSSSPVVYSRSNGSAGTISIPCHHIRIGDLLILQGRPCQVIRISTSSHTGQFRYLGVDLFTKDLHEETSSLTNPAPSVEVQNMYGPVLKQYRVLDINRDGSIVAMTETGEIKQSLAVLDQSDLSSRLVQSFQRGRGSVRVLVINDLDAEMVVDYKEIQGSKL